MIMSGRVLRKKNLSTIPSSSSTTNQIFYSRSKITARSAPSSLKLSASNDNDDSSSDERDSAAATPFLLYLQVLLPLLLVYISNQWSRASIYYLVDFSDTASSFSAMNVGLNLSQGEYGALASVAFTALFAITSLFAGNLADKYNRKYLTIGSCLVWAAATLATGLATDYTQVFTARIVMGLGAAFTTPAAYTLIRDIFPKSSAAFASSTYGSGVYFGGALASLTILLDGVLGWRQTCFAIAAFGVVAAAALSFAALPLPILDAIAIDNDVDVDDDAYANTGVKTVSITTTTSNNEDTTGLLNSAASVLSTPRVRWLFLASLFRFCSGLSIGVWGAPYFKLAFPDDASSYAVINALIVGICGATSGILGGVLSDEVGKRFNTAGYDANTGRLVVPIVGSLLAIPAWYLCVNAGSFDLAMLYLALEYLVAECWFGPIIAVLQSSVGAGKGGTAQGMFTLTGGIANLAPTLLGSIYGAATVADGSSEQQQVLAGILGTAVCSGYFLSAVAFALSGWSGLNDSEISGLSKSNIR